MKAILIDHEQAMLDLLEEKITRLSDIEIRGAYTNPHQGIIEVTRQVVDVVFIDISLPKVSGLELAEQLKQAMPDLKIVILASNEKHAVAAFDIKAEDYLVKPIEDDRLQISLSKIRGKMASPSFSQKPRINCFGKLHFRYYGSDKQGVEVIWRTAKAREVFAYLVHKRGALIRKDVIVNLFWPETSAKEAFQQLYTTIYQIRKSLASIELDIEIISLDNSYKLELNDNKTDVDAWEEAIGDIPIISKGNVAAYKALIYMYRGGYMEEENFVWSLNERNRLRVEWFQHMKRLLYYYKSVEDYSQAIILYLYYQKIAPYKNDSYFELMKLYAHFDDRYAVKEQYNLFKEMVAEEFGEEPDGRIVAWYENWQKE